MGATLRPPRATDKPSRRGKDPKPSIRRTIDDLLATLDRAEPWDGSVPQSDSNSGLPAPVVQVIETDTEYRLLADLPGLDLAAMDIVATDGKLTILGERTVSRNADDKGSHLTETIVEQFEHCFHLPGNVDDQAITAEMSGSMLTVTVPKTRRALDRKRLPSRRIA